MVEKAWRVVEVRTLVNDALKSCKESKVSIVGPQGSLEQRERFWTYV